MSTRPTLQSKTNMSLIKRVFTSRKKKPDFSARASMVQSPPAGQVTDRDDPNHEVWKPQSSRGDQTMDHRMVFFNSGFAICPICGERNIWRFEEKAGVRSNGNTYGTELFVCQTKSCGWKTSFLYDDGASTAHYETVGWPRGVMKYPVSAVMMWADKHKLSPAAKHQIYIHCVTGDKLLQLYHQGALVAQLGLDQKDIHRIKKAIKDPQGALLKQ